MSRSTRLAMRLATVTSFLGTLLFLGGTAAEADTVGDNSITTAPTVTAAGSGFPVAAFAWGLFAVLILVAGLAGSMRARHRTPEAGLAALPGLPSLPNSDSAGKTVA